ncbi:methyltransferase domain-containing protein [Streptomyces sp. XM4193]|uniref:methyltransferase domain-containing protein n=1 Tax=Streptomyces sp. XM4193 TaxID=2929782 RepID=UPI001FFAEB81|nr:methyltransferase domain-containing protein [Streptomyces sp. XM4193]MCK1798830.1 methyltransferase domain-containing protein [Streptomyces sp. XM4193]
MMSTLTPQHLRSAKDWAEIQERMLVPLYEAVYQHLGVGSRTRMLGLGCGSGLALLLAAARGARVVGTELDPARLALARARLAPAPQWGARSWSVQLLPGGPDRLPEGRSYDLVTVFDTGSSAGALQEAAARTQPGSPVVLAGWGTAEECAATDALRRAHRLTDPEPDGTHQPAGGRDALEGLAAGAGLDVADSGQVQCPFGYADVDSAVRGLLSTGVHRRIEQEADEERLGRELAEVLRERRRPDGTVWLSNLFHYVVARAA